MIAGDLVITEVFADYQAPAGGTGADAGKEWFEVYNSTDHPIDLKGLTLVSSRPDGSKSNSHEMTEITIAPGQFMTLGNATSDLLPPYVDYGYSADLGDLFNADGGKLALKCTDTEIDSASYDGVKAGHSRELTSGQPPDYTINDMLGNWCQANDTEFDPGNFGTPGQDNDCTPVVLGQCSDGGTMRDAVPPSTGDLVITEIMPKPSANSATTAQWFEVLAKKDLDLNGVGLDRANDTASPTVISSTSCIHMAAGSYGVFARSADMAANGNLTPLATFAFSINPSATPDVQLVYGATVIDAVSWTTSTTGKSLSLDPDFTDASSNDVPSNYCDGQTIYYTNTATTPKSDLGTPGAANEQCTAVAQPGMCLDAGTPRPIVKPTVGQLVITEALANPAGTGGDAMFEWVELLNTGAAAFDLNELSVKATSGSPYQILSSDCISVPAAAYALLAHSADPLVNGGLPVVDATFPSSINLATAFTVSDGATVIDTATWGTASDGKSRELQPAMLTSVANDTSTNFCSALAAQTYGATANLGTPKALNACQ